METWCCKVGSLTAGGGLASSRCLAAPSASPDLASSSAKDACSSRERRDSGLTGPPADLPPLPPPPSPSAKVPGGPCPPAKGENGRLPQRPADQTPPGVPKEVGV
eukprot:663930-Pyramimonas_sp.AAC.2